MHPRPHHRPLQRPYLPCQIHRPIKEAYLPTQAPTLGGVKVRLRDVDVAADDPVFEVGGDGEVVEPVFERGEAGLHFLRGQRGQDSGVG